ncbi:GIY-YIG nuclease family protein [Moritella sp. 24]|uniref:GIY-YIG nuclease family protein n=1 Tax=Moritella sp. 24 TaxID=2746230 RepID=UPI001BA98158|nr:GIY-YIG nuclease family protein [Moritella sp. 24]QUM76178.1 GIY-YIG nuclease family protein [Moritella sp. 24]
MILTDNYVYCFTNENGEVVYIGRGVGDRVDSHYGKHAHNDDLHKAIQEDGLTHSYLAINISEDQAISVESFAIILYDPAYNKARGSNTQNFFKPCVNITGYKKNRSALTEMKSRTIDFFKPFKNKMGEEAWFELANRLYKENYIDSWKTFNKVMADHLGIEYTQLVTNEERFGRSLNGREAGLVGGRIAAIRKFCDENKLPSEERTQLEVKYWSYINEIGIDTFLDTKKIKMIDVWKGIDVTEDRSNSGRRSGQYKGDVMADGKEFTSIDTAEKYYKLSSGTGGQRIRSTTFLGWYYINWCGEGKDPTNTKVTGTEEAKKAGADAARKSKRWWKHQWQDSDEKYLQRLKIWNELEDIYNFWFKEGQKLGSMRFNKALQDKGFKYESNKFYEKVINLLRNHFKKVKYEDELTEYEAALEEMKIDSIQDRIDELQEKINSKLLNASSTSKVETEPNLQQPIE